jgi:hypothetical protein
MMRPLRRASMCGIAVPGGGAGRESPPPPPAVLLDGPSRLLHLQPPPRRPALVRAGPVLDDEPSYPRSITCFHASRPLGASSRTGNTNSLPATTSSSRARRSRSGRAIAERPGAHVTAVAVQQVERHVERRRGDGVRRLAQPLEPGANSYPPRFLLGTVALPLHQGEDRTDHQPAEPHDARPDGRDVDLGVLGRGPRDGQDRGQDDEPDDAARSLSTRMRQPGLEFSE